MVKGMLVYSGGVAFGKSKIHLGYVHINEILNEILNEIQENEDENARIFGERIAKKVSQIF